MVLDAPGGFAPPLGRPNCDDAVLPVPRNGEFFRAGNARVITCAPAPNGGRAGARGAIIADARGFLQSRKNRTALPCRTEALIRGALITLHYFYHFYGLRMNSLGSCAFLQSRKINSLPVFLPFRSRSLRSTSFRASPEVETRMVAAGVAPKPLEVMP
jgi:hypothetical protein